MPPLFIPNCYLDPCGYVVQYTLCFLHCFFSLISLHLVEHLPKRGLKVCGFRGHQEVLLSHCSPVDRATEGTSFAPSMHAAMTSFYRVHRVQDNASDQGKEMLFI